MFEKQVKESGHRLDAWLAKAETDHSRARWQGLIQAGEVTVNGKVVKRNHKLCEGDRVEWNIPEPISTNLIPEKMALNIIYEDACLIVINKPAGLVVHPAAGNATGTLVNALLHHCTDLAGIGGEKRPGIVHRLDKDTSGVMVVAKTEASLNALVHQFKHREIEKEYLAMVRGALVPPCGTVQTTIGRHPVHRKKMATNVRNGRTAISHYERTESFPDVSLVQVKIETGRTHQIRVHMAHIKHPIVGDSLYGWKSGGTIQADRQMLHAVELSFSHPKTGECLTFRAPIPEDMKRLLLQLRRASDESIEGD